MQFGNDGNSGLTWADAKLTPKAAIDAAIAAAGDGHEIVISNGTYTLGATISISERMTVRSLDNNFTTVTLDGEGARRCIDVTSGAANTLIAGITVARGGRRSSRGWDSRGGGQHGDFECFDPELFRHRSGRRPQHDEYRSSARYHDCQ